MIHLVSLSSISKNNTFFLGLTLCYSVAHLKKILINIDALIA